MPVTLNAATRKLLDGKNFATVATIGPDGSPQASVVWVTRRDDKILFSTTTTRQKARNLTADARVSLCIFDLDNPYSYVEIRGRAELTRDEHKTLPGELARKYRGRDTPPESAEVIRLIVTITPDRVTGFDA